MELSYASKYHRLEEDHWWFSARRDMIYKLIKNYHRDSEILEIGCSGGPLIKFLKGQGFNNIQGIDINEAAIEICKQKGINNVRVADARKTGFKDQQFDIVIASDVLEHIKDEAEAASEWRRILKPGGKLFIFVPAFKFLWSKHDEVNCHYRRYTKSALINVLGGYGFKINRSSYWNICLFLPVAIIRILQRVFAMKTRKTGDQLQETNPVINKIFGYLLRFENKLLASGINYPFGISVFAVAERT